MTHTHQGTIRANEPIPEGQLISGTFVCDQPSCPIPAIEKLAEEFERKGSMHSPWGHQVKSSSKMFARRLREILRGGEKPSARR